MKETFKTIEQELGIEERREMVVGDKFWSLLQQKMLIHASRQVDNPQIVRVVFSSEHPYFIVTSHKILQSKDKRWLLAGYIEDTSEIHLNLSLKDIPREILAEVLTHELVHMVQDLTEKFPESFGKGAKVSDTDVDRDSPWEQEAYRLQKLLRDEFLKYCEII